MKNRLISMLLCICMLLSLASDLSFAIDNLSNDKFKDISKKDWYYESVQEAIKENIFSGTSKDTFSPNESMTRAMYVTIMGRIANVDNNISIHNAYFDDLMRGAYYVPYVVWAVEKGITQGVGNNKFSPEAKITREQMATLTVRLFDAYEIPYPESKASSLPKDLNKISPWAQEAVLKLWNSGLLKGDDKGNFNPQNNATRAEAAVFAVRVNESIKQWSKGLSENNTQIQNNNFTYSPTYYKLDFDSNGGSSTNSFSRREGGTLSNLPVPYKEGSVFGGWYYDKELTKLVGSNDILRENLTLYAKWGEAAPLPESEITRFASALDVTKDFTIVVKGLNTMSALDVKNLITVKNFNSQVCRDWIKVTKEDSSFIVSGINYSGPDGSIVDGFYEGASYRLTLNDDRLIFDGLTQEAREFNFTIKKEEVFNLSLSNKMNFIKFEDISDIEENGLAVRSINTTLMTVTGSDSGPGEMVEGTFKYNGEGYLYVGDTVSIYEGIHPNERTLNDGRVGADGNIAYLEITSVDERTYGYKTAEIDNVLFTPDVLPISIDADTDGDRYNSSITVVDDIFDFSDDTYSAIGLDSQTTVDVGDFISFYNGDLMDSSGEGERPIHEGYALITHVEIDGDMYIISYETVSLEELLAGMDMYNTDKIDGDEILNNISVAALETQIEQQAVDSGFAESAGQYLAAMAIETKSFTEITEDFELRNYQILNQNGEMLSPDEVRLMAGDGVGVEVKVKPPEATISTKLQHFDGVDGLRLTLKIVAEIIIGPKMPEDGDGQVVITLTGEFEEEVHLGINVNGGARWEWWFIFPYIAEYEVTANIDLYNYTGLRFHASIVTKEYSDDKWTDDEDLKNVVDELKKLVDEVQKGLGSEEEEDDPANDLIKKYKAMMDTESDWVNLVEKEIYEYGYKIPPIMIIEIKMEIKFVIQANMNISIGAEFWYQTAKRYTYNVEVFAGNVSSDILDLVEEQYEFTFYVMGTLGLRAGLKIEAKICLFDEKFASVGFGAESGAYIKMYGYFYYQLTYTASQGKESKYSGALYFELGIYLEITFEAQAFAGIFSYNPTLYENEWPLWHAGMRENIQEFAYREDEAPGIDMKKSIRTTFVPDSVFEMLYLDLKTGDSDTKIYDDSEQYFAIEMTNDKFSYDRATNRLMVTPDAKDIKVEGQMVISWINQPLAWTSKPISTRINLYWDNLNDGYALVFHSNGGSSVPIIIKKYGEGFNPPADPVKKGYIFEGWYSDKLFTQPYTIPETMPNADMEVYAKWIPATDTLYKVEHYGEVLGSSQYELLESVTLNGTTDSIIEPERLNKDDYPGFMIPVGRQIKILPDGSSTLRYYYERETYTLTFKAGEAQGEDIISRLKYGAKISPPTINSKGYVFMGWNPSIGENVKMEAGDITYIAQWSPASDTSYRVEYYVEQVNGKYTLQRIDSTNAGTTGSIVDIQKIFDNSYLITNGIVYKNTTVNGEATNTPTISKDGKLVIKVNYQRESHKAIFNPDNGDPSTIFDVKYQGTITQPTNNPTKQGYIFADWEVYSIGAIMGTSDITYKAKWNPATDTLYTVKHILQDLSGNYIETGSLVETETKIGTTDAQTEAEIKNYPGFTLETVTQTRILPDGTAEVKIKYSRNSYTVNWIADGNNYKTEQVKYEDTIIVPSANPTKEGYVFASWSGYGAGATMGISEQNFTANWNPATNTKYTVRHLREDLGGNYTIVELENKTGITETLTTASTRNYQGFTADTSYSQVEIKADGSAVVEIRYNRNSYTITWIANGVTYQIDQDIKYGSVITLPNSIPNNKTGYTFKSWINVPTNIPSQNMSFEASWTANNYTVTFNGNGGTTSESTITVTYDSNYGALPIPTRTGYKFVNWTLDSGATITGSSTVTTAYDHVLKATWAAETDIAYTVNHYQQNSEGDDYTFIESTIKYGITDTLTEAVSNTYTGFTVENFSQKNIDGNGLTEVNIYYNRKVHKVTWNINGIESIENYRYGKSIIPPDATRTGYSFSGWNTTVQNTMPDRDLSYTATWIANQYLVSFDGNSGSSPNPVTVIYDSTYGVLPTPDRIGYNFEGWFTSLSDGSEVTNSTIVTITGYQTLFAKWVAKSYTVNFDLNTGTGTSPALITVTYDGEYASLPENSGSKLGYTFIGWYTAATGGIKITNSTIVTITGDQTLYAQWQANNYLVIFDKNDGSGSMENQIHTYDQEKSLTLNNFVKTGHSFNGWNINADGSGTGYSNTASVKNLGPDGSITLYAQWKINSYTISFDSNEGSYVASITQDYGTEVSAPEVPIRNGYIFVGWQRSDLTSFTFNTMTAENITLTAKWNPVNYTINYELNGGTNNPNPSSYNIESGNIILQDPSAKVGYTFEGWYTDTDLTSTNKLGDIAITQGTTGEKTFHAKWTPNTYTVTFYKNIGDGTSTSQSFTYDEEIKALTANSFTINGYTFDGWNTKSDGTGTKYIDNQMVKNLVEDGTLNLYAQWNLITYSITYHLNGGTQAAGNPSSFTVESNDFTLADPSRDNGYGFMGWYDNVSFTGSKITTITKGSTGDKTLYAKWGFAGTFSVTNNNNNTFTITRTGNGSSDAQNVGQQIVYFRTINGSAIGGTHFVHQGGSIAAVTFTDGEISKTVEVIEYGVTSAYNGITATSYSNIDRTYQLELLRVVGGGLLGSTTKATRTIAKNNDYVVSTTVYDRKTLLQDLSEYTLKEDGNTGKNAMYYNTGNPLLSAYNSYMQEYLVSTGSKAKIWTTFDYRDTNWWTYRFIQLGTSPSQFFTNSLSGDVYTVPPIGGGARFNANYGRPNYDSNEWRTFSFPNYLMPASGVTNAIYKVHATNWAPGQNSDTLYVKFELGEIPMISMVHYQKEVGNDSGYTRNIYLYGQPLDTKEPSKIGIAPMATGEYKAGETVTIAVVFDEIVASLNGASISGTNLNTMTYAGGLNSNVIYFTGTVKSNCNEESILSGITLIGTVLDMVN